MPEKHFYFSLGAVLGSLICSLIAKFRHSLRKHNSFVRWLYRKEPHWFLFFPVVIFLVGCWGLVPDIFHALGVFPKDVTRSAIFDIFFFHSTFEYIEGAFPIVDRYLNWAGEFFLVIIALGSMLYYIFQAKKAIKKIDSQ